MAAIKKECAKVTPEVNYEKTSTTTTTEANTGEVGRLKK